MIPGSDWRAPQRRVVLRRLLLYAAISLITRGISLAIPIIDKDEGCYAVGAREILRGRLLYVDFADQHPPGAYLYYAAAQFLTGGGMFGLRLLTLLLVIPLTALAASAFFRHDRRGLLAGVTYLVFSAAFFGHDMQAVNCEVLMLLPLAWAAVLLRDQEWATRSVHAAGAGLLTGLAVVVKYQSALWGLAFALAILLASLRQKKLGALPVRWLALAGGFAAPLLITWLSYAARGAGRDFLYWNLTYNFAYASNPMVPREIWGKAFSYLVPFLGVTLPLWWGCVRAQREHPGDHALLLATALLVCSIPAAFVGFRFYPHYFIQLYLPLALASAPVAARIFTRPWGRGAKLLGAYAVLAWAGFTAATAYRYLGRQLPTEETAHVFRRVADRLRADPCFPGANLYCWGYSPLFYYEADLPVASRFIMVQTGLTGYISGNAGSVSGSVDARSFIRPEHWDWLMQDLERNRPTYIVDTSPAGLRHWDKFPIADFPRLAALVNAEYERIAVVDSVRIYRRRGCAGS